MFAYYCQDTGLQVDASAVKGFILKAGRKIQHEQQNVVEKTSTESDDQAKQDKNQNHKPETRTRLKTNTENKGLVAFRWQNTETILGTLTMRHRGLSVKTNQWGNGNSCGNMQPSSVRTSYL